LSDLNVEIRRIRKDDFSGALFSRRNLTFPTIVSQSIDSIDQIHVGLVSEWPNFPTRKPDIRHHTSCLIRPGAGTAGFVGLFQPERLPEEMQHNLY
jgi:hypothetical protein